MFDVSINWTNVKPALFPVPKCIICGLPNGTILIFLTRSVLKASIFRALRIEDRQHRVAFKTKCCPHTIIKYLHIIPVDSNRFVSPADSARGDGDV